MFVERGSLLINRTIPEKPLTLPPQSEEVAGFFAALLETDHASDAKFVENFFKDFQRVLKDYPPVSDDFGPR